MIKSTFNLKEIQKIELGILKYFHDVCSENNLNYYLAYGTLIGAIRHKGFIPWDDDIDVMMPREDYYKLVQILNDNPHDNYRLVSYETNSLFTAPLPKIIDIRTRLIQNYDFFERVPLGIYIDIFLLDGAKNTYDEALKWYNKSFKLYKKWRIADLPLFPPGKSKLYGFIRYIKNIPYKIHPLSFYLNEMKKNNSIYSFYDCEFVSTLETGDLPNTKAVWPRSFFEPHINVEFEGLNFFAPCNYDEVLRSAYGDYSILPPIEMRQPKHSYSLEVDEDFLNKVKNEYN